MRVLIVGVRVLTQRRLGQGDRQGAYYEGCLWWWSYEHSECCTKLETRAKPTVKRRAAILRVCVRLLCKGKLLFSWNLSGYCFRLEVCCCTNCSAQAWRCRSYYEGDQNYYVGHLCGAQNFATRKSLEPGVAVGKFLLWSLLFDGPMFSLLFQSVPWFEDGKEWSSWDWFGTFLLDLEWSLWGSALLLISTLRHPNRVIIFSYKKIATVLVSFFFTALASVHFVRYFVAIITYAIPLEE